MLLRVDSQKLVASRSCSRKKNPPRDCTCSRTWPSRWVLPEPAVPRTTTPSGLDVREPLSVGECVHHLLECLVVDTWHVEDALGVPQIVGRRRERQAKGLEGVPGRGIHHDSIAIR